ncbi:hypothetical protein L3Q65_46135 [Amycolatopsis sp. FU40]|uniref:hypothetical protein n=1 Tax=Amycolatopsis sp. FU40 TaxID=2914159 RepID=UPI001F296346|nr:hypothetical protein [Amycolatopsis sp. FU40]UKD55155.1 hypothetical protein L3Q65_46135 [Amycolatopsis sp. FU40]
MTAPVLPHLAGLARALLLADPAFVALAPGGLASAAPADVTRPFAVMLTSVTPINAAAGAYRADLAINGCASAAFDGKQPLTAAWDIAARAAALFATVRNGQYEQVRYSARVTDGPMEMPIDKSRGTATPVFGVQVRAELTLHAH